MADYFRQIRNNKDYIPDDREMTYIYEILQMLSAMTGDSRIENVYNEVDKRNGGGRRMCEYVDMLESRGAAKERESGIKALVKTCCRLGIAPEVTEKELITEYSSEKAKEYIKNMPASRVDCIIKRNK